MTLALEGWEERLILMEQKIDKIHEALIGDELHGNGGLVARVKQHSAKLKELDELGVAKTFASNTETIKKLDEKIEKQDEEMEEMRNEWAEFKGHAKGYAAGVSAGVGLIVAVAAKLWPG